MLRCCRQGRGDVCLFDLNMKPNMSGPGRKGRQDQLNLVGMAAGAIGWDFGTLVHNIASNTWPITDLN